MSAEKNEVIIPEGKRKILALHNLGKALFMADIGVKDLQMINSGIVQITYDNGNTKAVNICGDSVLAMIVDVLNAARRLV